MRNGASGFHVAQKGWEDQPAGEERYKRIIVSLKRFIEHQNPDLIVFQETSEEFLGAFIKEFPEWTMLHENTGPLMLIRSKVQGGRLEIKEHSFLGRVIEIPSKTGTEKFMMGGCQTALCELNGRLIRIYNVHSPFRQTPETA